MRTVLPGVMDVESTVQDKAVELVLSTILEPITKKKTFVRNERVCSKCCSEKKGIWMLLSSLDSTSMRYLERACSVIAKQKLLPAGLVKALQLHAEENDTAVRKKYVIPIHVLQGAWVIMGELCAHVPQQFDPDVLLRSWERIQQASTSMCTLVASFLTAQHRQQTSVWK